MHLLKIPVFTEDMTLIRHDCLQTKAFYSFYFLTGIGQYILHDKYDFNSCIKIPIIRLILLRTKWLNRIHEISIWLRKKEHFSK